MPSLELKTILDSKTDSEILVLTTEQRNEIIASKKEIALGRFTENSQLEEEMKKLLKEN